MNQCSSLYELYTFVVSVSTFCKSVMVNKLYFVMTKVCSLMHSTESRVFSLLLIIWTMKYIYANTPFVITSSLGYFLFSKIRAIQSNLIIFVHIVLLAHLPLMPKSLCNHELSTGCCHLAFTYSHRFDYRNFISCIFMWCIHMQGVK